MAAKTRGISFAISIPTLARLENITPEIPQIGEKLNLRDIIGEGTQELSGLENIAIFAIMHPNELFRKTCSQGIILCSQGMIRDIYVDDGKVYVTLQDDGFTPKHAYLCDLPEKYQGKTVYSFLYEWKSP